MKVTIETLGCKLNQAESDELVRRFTDAGHTIVSRQGNPDVYILNTCTVTHIADRKARHLFRMLKKKNPDVKIIATGCYAHRAPLEVAEVDEVDIVTGNGDKLDLVQRLQENGILQPSTNEDQTKPASKRTRAFVKVQDGCNNFCSYCIVPYVRQGEKSLPPQQILNDIKKREAEGFKEIVLTGTRIGGYLHDGVNLEKLLSMILKETEIPRIRVSSLQPQEITTGLLALWKNNRLCPHFHLSLQSGSDTVLQRMRRRYTISEYEKTVDLIRLLVPDVAITTDVIVGFPGETDQEFQDSYAFCRRMEFAKIHVFPYSPRSGTMAVKMPDKVPDKVKKARTDEMLALADETERNFRERYAGVEMDVLWEQETDKGVWSGVTGNYIRVYRRDSANLENQIGKGRP